MREGLTITGFILLLVGIFFTAVTGGFGVVLGGPVALLGFILLLIGAFSSEQQTITIQQEQADVNTKRKKYCKECGRAIPFDARLCPYCGNDGGD